MQDSRHEHGSERKRGRAVLTKYRSISQPARVPVRSEPRNEEQLTRMSSHTWVKSFFSYLLFGQSR